MEERKYQYDAFISYRHLPEDKRVAVRLQQLLERHKITEQREGTAKRRPLRIFRDQSELPTSGDLGGDIRQALEHSNYLIVVCSKQFCASKWCMKEIEIFRSLHGMSNFHILPLLIEGEPGESFPEVLRREWRTVTDHEGKDIHIEVEVEPLGADVRAGSIRGMLRRLRTEYLRIAAPILGCAYDDLYRRGQRQAFWRIAAGTALGLAAVSSFWIYSVFMLGQIREEQEGLYRAESLRLADLAEQKIEAGEYREAMLLAEEALPDDLEDPERPLTEEALTALRSAVTQQMSEENSESLMLQARITFNVTGWMPARTCAAGEKVVVTDFNQTYLYDARTGALLFSCAGDNVTFNDAGTRAVRVTERENGSGDMDVLLEGFAADGDGPEPYFTGEYEIKGDERSREIFGIWDEDTGDCHVVQRLYAYGEGVSYEPVERYDSRGAAKEAAPLSEELLERCGAHSSEYYMSSEMAQPEKDADYWEGEASEALRGDPEALTMIQMLERAVEEAGGRMRSAALTKDGRLAVINVEESGNLVLFIGIREMKIVDAKSGSCYVDRESGLLYVSAGEALEIYTYLPENFAFADPESETVPLYRSLSADGRKGLTMTVSEQGDEEWARLTLRDLEHGQKILLEAEAEARSGLMRYVYFTTPDMERIFYKEAQGGPLRLCAGDGECLLELECTEEETVTAVSVDPEGERVAAAFLRADGGLRVEVRMAADGGLLRELAFDADENAWGIQHMEFEKEQLLVCTGDQSWIVGLEEGRVIRTFAGGNPCRNSDGFLTEDGLLFCTINTNTSFTLQNIYDTGSGAEVYGGGMARSWQYEEETGILAYQEMTYASMNAEIRLARRGEDGIFQDYGTIRPGGKNASIMGVPGNFLEGNYLLAAGEDLCEVYRTDTGERVLTLRGNGYGWGIAGEKLCDLRVQEGKNLNRYAILEAEELKQKAQEYLTSEFGLRRLTEEELDRYYISEGDDSRLYGR